MTKSFGLIKEGSGSTFEIYHALLTPFWWPIRSSESQNYLWHLVTYLNPEFQLSKYDQQFRSYKRREWQHFWSLLYPFTPFWLPLRSSESQNYLWNLVTYLNPEFQLSMTNSSGFIREGSGSTFEVCHALLTPFLLSLRALWVPKLLIKSGYLSKSWISTFYHQQFWIYRIRA